MRTACMVLAAILLCGGVQAGQRRNDDKSAPPRAEGRGKDAKDKGGKNKSGDKDKPSRGKAGNGVAGPAASHVPPGIAKQGDEKVQKWMSSRGQLKKDLDDIYDRDEKKRRDKSQRQTRAEELFDALSDLGMDADRASGLLRRMASSRDKDDAYETVRRSVGEAKHGGMKDDAIISDVGRIIDGAESAAAIGEALGKWRKRK